MRVVQLLSIVAVCTLLSACYTVNKFVATKGTGQVKIYAQPKARVWPLAVDSVGAVGLQLRSVDDASNVIVAERSTSAFSYGERVAIFVEDQPQQRTRVEVIVKRTVQTGVPSPDSAAAIFYYIDTQLKR